ncbi:MAG: hypothetical protein N4A65_00895 [Cohaesibacter sp.]|jgi:hypothetical protein|nr:hypothetical protein [Cohaesibacter sp.]
MSKVAEMSHLGLRLFTGIKGVVKKVQENQITPCQQADKALDNPSLTEQRRAASYR